jgi:hypothetical protein
MKLAKKDCEDLHLSQETEKDNQNGGVLQTRLTNDLEWRGKEIKNEKKNPEMKRKRKNERLEKLKDEVQRDATGPSTCTKHLFLDRKHLIFDRMYEKKLGETHNIIVGKKTDAFRIG